MIGTRPVALTLEDSTEGRARERHAAHAGQPRHATPRQDALAFDLDLCVTQVARLAGDGVGVEIVAQLRSHGRSPVWGAGMLTAPRCGSRSGSARLRAARGTGPRAAPR